MDNDAINACAAHVERGDPDRFLATMAAPVAARGALFTLYAFNLELARLPWVTREPMIAQMRLQFWRDVVTGESPAAHEIAGPLQGLMAQTGLGPDALLAMIDAREAEIGTQTPFADAAGLMAYLDGTGGALMVAAVQALGGPVSAQARALGTAQALANYLMAVPALVANGRHPLPDGRPAAVAALASEGLERLAVARRGLRRLPRPALLAAWRAGPLLRQVTRDPGSVAAGALGQSEFARRGSLLWHAFVGI